MTQKEIERTEIEAPYELPEGWKWCKLGDVAILKGGKRIPAGKKCISEKTPHVYIRVTDMQNDTVNLDNLMYITDDIYSAIKNYTISKDDLYLTIAGTIGRVGIIPDCLDGMNLTENALKITDIKCDKKYLLYVLKSDFTQNYFFNSYHQVAMPKVSILNASNTKIPLPPTLAEQQRIVNRIESMFAKLDQAQKKAQAVLDSFETRKAAILHKAFTGQLRIDNEELKIEDWEEKKLEDVIIEKPRNGYSTTAVDYETPYKTMSLSATTSGYFRPEFYKYIEADISDDSFLWLKPGDILIQRANSLDKVGTSAIYTGGEHEFIYPDLMMKLQVRESVSNAFIAYQLKTEESLAYFRNNATGTAGNMPKINQKTVCNLPIKLPSLNYQLSISSTPCWKKNSVPKKPHKTS